MRDFDLYEKRIRDRIAELDTRVHEIDHELGQPKSADLADQAIDLEDDEVLERLSLVSEKEIGLLHGALQRIEDGSYGLCTECGDPISDARLRAVPFALLCRNCVSRG